MTPRLSVLMAARDADATIRESVASALRQTEERIEVIVLDDGSARPVASTLADIDDPRLVILRAERSRGISAARNAGLHHARSPFISQLDADDLWEPDYAERVLPHFEDPRVGLVYTNARLIGHPLRQELYIEDESVHPMDRFPKFAEQNPVPSPTATMRTEAVRRVGGYARWLRIALDYELYGRLIMAGWHFAYVNRPLATYRWPQPGRGISFDRRATELEELRLWLAFVARHPRVPGPRRQVRVRLRRELERLVRRAHRP